MDDRKQGLIDYLEERVLRPAEVHPGADATLKKKINVTRMRLVHQCQDAAAVQQYFWSAMATTRGNDSYSKLKAIDATTFEDVRVGFDSLCATLGLHRRVR